MAYRKLGFHEFFEKNAPRALRIIIALFFEPTIQMSMLDILTIPALKFNIVNLYDLRASLLPYPEHHYQCKYSVLQET